MPFFVKRNGRAVPIVSEPNVINDTTASQNTSFSGSKVDSLIANTIDALTPKVYSLFVAKTDWDETGTVEIDVPGTFGYDIPSENYNQLVLSDEQTDHWRRFNVCLDHAHDASGKITTIEFSCDPGNIPDRPIYFNIVSSKSEYVDWSVIGNLIVPPGLQVDTSFDSDSTNPVQNKVIKSALDGKATPADIAALIDDTTAAQNKTYSSAKVEEKVAGEEITTTATGTDLTLSTSSGNLNALTVYGKSEVVDGAIVSAGEGYAAVRLADLSWRYASGHFISNSINSTLKLPISNQDPAPMICSKYKAAPWSTQLTDKIIISPQEGPYHLWIKDVDYTTVSDFVASLGDATLCYKLIDPTQGNAIAVKTDDGTGVNGTMATFTTGTPLRGITGGVQDVMAWDGSSGEVTKNCNKVRLADLTWQYYSQYNSFVTDSISDKQPVDTSDYSKGILCNKYPAYNAWWTENTKPDKTISCTANVGIAIKDTDYTTVEDFVASLGDAELVYELATPTTEQLTTAENDSIAGLRTYTPQTAISINDSPEFEFTAYSGNNNGKAVAELKQDIDDVASRIPTIDSALSDTSTNPVQNKVIKSALEGKQSPLSLGQYSGLGREIQIMEFDEVGQTWYNTGIVDIEPSSSEGKLTVSKVDDSVFPGSAPYTSEDIDIPGWEKVENSPITVSATGSDLTLSTAEGNLNALTVYGKSEVVDGAIVSAGEGWNVVRLADLTWTWYEAYPHKFAANIDNALYINGQTQFAVCSKYKNSLIIWGQMPDKHFNIGQPVIAAGRPAIAVHDTDYTTVSDFVASLGDATLAYQLADPTQGNCVAIKTDNGSGINGTMATFTTGTPLRGIPDSNVRDVMAWDGSSGEVTKKCGDINLGDYTWYGSTGIFYVPQSQLQQIPKPAPSNNIEIPLLCDKYPASYANDRTKKMIAINSTSDIVIYDPDYTNPADLKTSLSGVHLIYPIANPTTEQLTTAENDSIAGLRTYTPQTHAQNNAQAEMTVEAYAGTANGRAVNELKQDVQSEISALKITQSATLTLTTAGWSSNQQTVTYAHDTAKRNVVDVDPSSVEEWASCGVLATAETASGITFKCSTVPTNALNFRVTSMGV